MHSKTKGHIQYILDSQSKAHNSFWKWKCFGEIKYLYWKINKIDPSKLFQSLNNRVFYIFDNVEKIYATEGIIPKICKSFLNCTKKPAIYDPEAKKW